MVRAVRQVAVLGATGSIGSSTLDVIARHPARFRASVLSAHDNVEELVALCLRFRPDIAIIANEAHYATLRDGLADAGLETRAMASAQALADIAGSDSCDTVVAALVGAAGLGSTLAAAKAGKRILLANKEAIVVAGALLTIPAWCAFALLHDDGALWALHGLLLVWAADTFAYFPEGVLVARN